MIANLTAGNKIKFQYVDRKNDRTHLPAHVTSEIKNYEGTLLEIRDLFNNRLEWKTLVKSPEVERSRYLLMPASTIQDDVRGAIKTALAGVSANVYDHVPEAPQVPAGVS